MANIQIRGMRSGVDDKTTEWEQMDTVDTDAVFWRAKYVSGALEEELEKERQTETT